MRGIKGSSLLLLAFGWVAGLTTVVEGSGEVPEVDFPEAEGEDAMPSFPEEESGDELMPDQPPTVGPPVDSPTVITSTPPIGALVPSLSPFIFNPINRNCNASYSCIGPFGKVPYLGSHVCFPLPKQQRQVNLCAPNSLLDAAFNRSGTFCGFCPREETAPTQAPTGLSNVCDPIVECGDTAQSLLICLDFTQTGQLGGVKTEVCVNRNKIADILFDGVITCGPCPEEGVTPAPSDFIAQPTTLIPVETPRPTVMGETVAPTNLVLPTLPPSREQATSAPTRATCDPIVPCEAFLLGPTEGVKVCLTVGGNTFEACIGPTFLSLALENGFCGECPATTPPLTPTDAPNESVTILPSLAPSSLDGICEPAHPCIEHVGATYVGVDFCLSFPNQRTQFTMCMPTRFIQGAIALGKSEPWGPKYGLLMTKSNQHVISFLRIRNMRRM